jgi:hypothetical protein
VASSIFSQCCQRVASVPEVMEAVSQRILVLHFSSNSLKRSVAAPSVDAA